MKFLNKMVVSGLGFLMLYNAAPLKIYSKTVGGYEFTFGKSNEVGEFPKIEKRNKNELMLNIYNKNNPVKYMCFEHKIEIPENYWEDIEGDKNFDNLKPEFLKEILSIEGIEMANEGTINVGKLKTALADKLGSATKDVSDFEYTVQYGPVEIGKTAPEKEIDMKRVDKSEEKKTATQLRQEIRADNSKYFIYDGTDIEKVDAQIKDDAGTQYLVISWLIVVNEGKKAQGYNIVYRLNIKADDWYDGENDSDGQQTAED